MRCVHCCTRSLCRCAMFTDTCAVQVDSDVRTVILDDVRCLMGGSLCWVMIGGASNAARGQIMLDVDWRVLCLLRRCAWDA